MYIYIYIYTHMHVHIYIYIYICCRSSSVSRDIKMPRVFFACGKAGSFNDITSTLP